MFDIGWSEILVIAVVAIVVVGPKDLPPMLRAAGRMVSKARKTAGEFQAQFNEALREAELDGVQESIKELRGLNPLNEIKKSLDPIAAAIARPESAPKLPPAAPAPVALPEPSSSVADAAITAEIEPAPTVPVAAAPLDMPAALTEAKAEADGLPPKRSRKAKPKAEASEGVAVTEAAPGGEGAAVPKPVRKRAVKPVENVETAGNADLFAAAEPPAKKPRASRAKPKAADAAPTAVAAVLPEATTPVVTPSATATDAAPSASAAPSDPVSSVAALPPVPTSEEHS